jgi:pimeloyl-ACP methyl ester carboxylesterase
VGTLTVVEPPAFWVLPNHGCDDAGAREMQEFVTQWTQWVRFRNSLGGLHTIGDYKDDPARLRTVGIPALVVHGADTVAFHRAINTALLRLLPRAEVLELSGGHNSPSSAADYFVAEWQRCQQRAKAAEDSRR